MQTITSPKYCGELRCSAGIDSALYDFSARRSDSCIDGRRLRPHSEGGTAQVSNYEPSIPSRNIGALEGP